MGKAPAENCERIRVTVEVVCLLARLGKILVNRRAASTFPHMAACVDNEVKQMFVLLWVCRCSGQVRWLRLTFVRPLGVARNNRLKTGTMLCETGSRAPLWAGIEC